MTEEVCHGGGSEYTKWNRASRHWVKVKLKRTREQGWRVQWSLLIWGLSLVGGCWENKMGIQWAVDRRRGVGLQVCRWQVCVVVHRQGNSSESHRAAQRRPADWGAGPGGGRGFQGELLFTFQSISLSFCYTLFIFFSHILYQFCLLVLPFSNLLIPLYVHFYLL